MGLPDGYREAASAESAELAEKTYIFEPFRPKIAKFDRNLARLRQAPPRSTINLLSPSATIAARDWRDTEFFVV